MNDEEAIDGFLGRENARLLDALSTASRSVNTFR